MNKKKLMFFSAIANTFEWYDYSLYAHSIDVITKKFFPINNSDNLLQAFWLFAIGYLMRPLGGIFFGIIGDIYGRKVSLSLAIICMAFPMLAITLLPSYDSIGVISTNIMFLMRIIQGLSMGGVLTSSITYAIEHDINRKGLIGSIPMASICIGILFGAVVVQVVKYIFSEEVFILWAWRIPFFVGFIIIFIGIYFKYHSYETPLFKKAKNSSLLTKIPLKIVLTKHLHKIIISIFINASGSVLFYIVAIYMQSYLVFYRGFQANYVGFLNNICYLLMAFIAVFIGWLSDRVERKKIYIINLIAIALLYPILIFFIVAKSFLFVCIAQLLLSILAAIYIGPEPALQFEMYPTNIRNTSLALSYNIATSIFGGTAPYLMQSAVTKTGTIISSVYYIWICVLLGLVALYFYNTNNRG